MKKEAVSLCLIGILLILPLISAQEQVQTYSGFNRFVDNARLFFSFGDDKIGVALEIREKEVNSAILNAKNGEETESDKNLQNAWKKLQLIQEKISLKTAEQVQENSDGVIDTINQEEDLSETFDVYLLEEEKTSLTAEWVIEKNGEQGQNLSWEVVGNDTGVQTRTVAIEKRIDEIDGKISEWVVEHTYAEGTSAGGEAGVVVEGGLANTVRTEVANGDNGLKWEVKTSVNAGEGDKNGVVENKKDAGGYAPGTSAGGGSGSSPGDTVDDTYDDDNANDDSGDCGDGVVCGGADDVIDDSSGDDSNDDAGDTADDTTSSGGSGDSSITGEVVRI